MTAAFFLGQDINLALELGQRMDGVGLRQNLATLNALLVDATQQSADVVAGFCVVQQLVEHFDVGDDGVQLVFTQTNDFHRLVLLHNATLHTAGSHGATTGDGEDVFHRHQEGLIGLPVGSGDIVIHGVHELLDAGILGSGGIGGVGHQSVQSGALDDGDFVAGELVVIQSLADFHLNQLQQLLVVHLVALVQEHNDSGHAHLTGQEQVLFGLSHGAVGSSDYQDGAVHLCSAGDHVLDIVGVTRAVHMGIVPLLGLVLHVSGVNCDTTRLLLGSLIDGVIGLELGLAGEGQVLGDGSGQGSLAVVNVANGANVDMGLGSFKFLLSH